MRQVLPSGQPLFELLFDFASRMNAARLPLRIIGGMALYFMHCERNSPPRTTADLDCAFPAGEWPSEEDARQKILGLVSVLRDELGLQRELNDKDKASRTARFTYNVPGRDERIEILCGKLCFGSPSRRPPAWRLMCDEAGEMVYASKLEWIDLVPEWAPVEIVQGTATARLEIPCLAGMLLLKLKAVVDKLGRCRDEQDTQRRLHELGRLQRHAEDLICLVAWARVTPGVFRQYETAVSSSEQVREVSQQLHASVLAAPPKPELSGLFERLREASSDL